MPTSPPVKRLDLSVLIRTFNEADRIAAAINSVKEIADEIIVIDSGSTDRTVEVCRSLGARVVFNPWLGFGPQRYFGEERCSHRYVFSLDADEVVTPAMAAEISRVLSASHPPALLMVKKAIVFPHRQKPPPLGFCHEQILIYDKAAARTAANPNWDKLEISIKERPHRLREPLHHFSFRDWRHAVAKASYVAKLAAETQTPKSRLELRMRMIFELPYTFLKFYFLRRYFLGGFDGFVMAVVTAFGRWLRIAMMYEAANFSGDNQGRA
jgi:glycosyltransferase involved in cell wall biosynthesis